MTRPKNRTQTLLFSRYAVICQRDGELTLMFRVGDMRKSHIIASSVRAQLIKTKTTKEGEVMSQYTTELEVGTDGCSNDLFFIWPMVVAHKINHDSPLYNMSASDLIQQERFEIVVILEGTVELIMYMHIGCITLAILILYRHCRIDWANNSSEK